MKWPLIRAAFWGGGLIPWTWGIFKTIDGTVTWPSWWVAFLMSGMAAQGLAFFLEALAAAVERRA